jgi:hypothetical protein
MTATASDIINNNNESLLLNVKRGLVPGHRIIGCFGWRNTIGTTSTGEDIWNGTATTIPTPIDAGEQLEIVSTSTDDDGDPAGTGAQTVMVHYIDAADGQEKKEQVTMNGTTGVPLVATNIRYVNEFHVLTVGSNGVAVGTITCYKQGASSTVYSQINPGMNHSLQTNCMIPDGHNAYLMSWYATESADKRSAFRIRSTDNGGNLLPGVFNFKDNTTLKASSTGIIPLWQKIPALSIVKVSAWVSPITGAEGSAGWTAMLVKD